MNKTSTVNNSSRPSNMAADNNHVAVSERDAKLFVGPINGPSPGPTLAIAVAAPLVLVMKS